VEGTGQPVAARTIGHHHGHVVKRDISGSPQHLGHRRAPLGNVVGDRDDTHLRSGLGVDKSRFGRSGLAAGDRRFERSGCVAVAIDLEPEALEEGPRRGGVGTNPPGPGQEGRERPVGGQGRDEGRLHGRKVVDPEEGDRHAGADRRRSLCGGLGGQGVEPGIVEEPAAAQRGEVVAVESREIARLVRPDRRQRVGGHAGLAQIVDGARQRARQAGCTGDRCEIPGLLVGALRDECRDQTLAQQRRQQIQMLETVGGKFGGQRVDRDESHTGVRPQLLSDGPREMTGCEVRTGHDDDRAQRVAALDCGDPAGEGRFEPRAAAKDESSVRAVGADRHGPGDYASTWLGQTPDGTTTVAT
jgi:hypothetical protein